jgi:hypothetical protein
VDRHQPATFGDRADERGQFFPAVLAGCLLLLTLTASGCAGLLGAPQPSTDLQNAGFQDVTVNISNRPGQSGEQVAVDYGRGPTGNDNRDAQRAEKIVWDTLPGRFAVVAIIKERECGDQVCSGYYPQTGAATHAQLAAEYGPRPHGLDNASAAGHASIAGWVTAVSVAVLAAAAIVLVVIFRRRRRRPPPRAASPSPPAPGWPPPGPQTLG